MPIDELRIEHCAEYHAQMDYMKDTMKKLEADVHETKEMVILLRTELAAIKVQLKIISFLGGAFAIALIGVMVKLIFKA